ncbi:hypothetical protein HPB50_006620 [Hyalomma asiaticum]|uniref:Uncharacterized protein n=1 Tax=Hyalomma asiaticum TaxID=266040 RepID=A0ACB7S812_HYAAI|nr:hypothetical protein HPB50_006620 [Hyalomma asiaticum]
MSGESTASRSIPAVLSQRRVCGSNVRLLVAKAGQEAQERCLLEGVEALKKTVNTKVSKVAKDPTKRVVSFFEENNLRLLQADKTGGFFVLREEDFSRKAEQAIAKNFVRVKPSATRIKSRVD